MVNAFVGCATVSTSSVLRNQFEYISVLHNDLRSPADEKSLFYPIQGERVEGLFSQSGKLEPRTMSRGASDSWRFLRLRYNALKKEGIQKGQKVGKTQGNRLAFCLQTADGYKKEASAGV